MHKDFGCGAENLRRKSSFALRWKWEVFSIKSLTFTRIRYDERPTDWKDFISACILFSLLMVIEILLSRVGILMYKVCGYITFFHNLF